MLNLTLYGKKRCCRNVRAVLEQRELSEGQGRLKPRRISAHLQLDHPLTRTAAPSMTYVRTRRPLSNLRIKTLVFQLEQVL